MKGLALGLMAAAVLAAPTMGWGESEKPAFQLDTVVVTASGGASDFKTGDVDLETAPTSVTVIERAEFEGKTESLAEVIEKTAGVQVRQSGGLGSFSSVSLRGSSSDQVLVFLDGVLLNEASGGGVDLSSIALSDVAAIEIYRGTSPINFGKASIGGAVNIRTRRTGEDFGAAVTAGYGAFDACKLSAFINHKPGRWDYLLSADYLGSENDYDILNDNGTAYNKDDDRWEPRRNAAFDQFNLLGKAGFDLSDTHRVELVDQYFDKGQELPAWNNSGAADTTFDTRRNIATLQFIADDLTDLHLNTRTRVTHSWKREEYDDRGGHIGLSEQDSLYTTNRWTGDVYAEWLTDWNTLGLFAEVYREDYESEDRLGKTNPIEAERDSVALGVQDTVFLMDERLVVSPAVRWNWIRDELKGDTGVWGADLPGQSRETDHFSPQIGLVYRVFDGVRLKTNLARYVREPAFYELFGDRGFLIGNNDLSAEKGINFDIGAEADRQWDTPWVQGVSAGLTYFRTEVDDLITQVYDSRGIGRSVNVDEADIQGIEARLSLDFLNYFRLAVDATWQDPENQSGVDAFDGKNLPGRFKTAYSARLEARFRGWKAHLEYLREADMFYDAANLLPAEDKEEINAGISWLWEVGASHLSSLLISLEGRNLGDDLYEDFNGYPQPGRSWFCTVKYAF